LHSIDGVDPKALTLKAQSEGKGKVTLLLQQIGQQCGGHFGQTEAMARNNPDDVPRKRFVPSVSSYMASGEYSTAAIAERVGPMASPNRRPAPKCHTL
jgi:hypothetical protein